LSANDKANVDKPYTIKDNIIIVKRRPCAVDESITANFVDSSTSFPQTTALEYGSSVNDNPHFYTPMCTTLREKVLGPETPFIGLFLIYALAMYAVFAAKSDDDERIFFIVFMITYGLQRLPIVILAIWIVFNMPRTVIEGPSPSSKLILLFASILDLVNNLPVTVWASIINNDTCPLYILSYADVVHLLFCIAQVLFFVFLRAEFMRNKEQFVYTTVQTHKDYEHHGFDWRVFNNAEINARSSSR